MHNSRISTSVILLIILAVIPGTSLVSCSGDSGDATQPVTLESVVSDLQSNDSETILNGLRDCAGFLTDPQVTSALVANLSNPDPVVAEQTRAKLIESGAAAMPGVIDALADPLLRQGALYVVTHDNVPHHEAVPRILELVEDETVDIQVTALEYFDLWGDGGHDITGFMQKALSTGSDPEAVVLALSTMRTQRYRDEALVDTIATNLPYYRRNGLGVDAAKTLAFLAPLPPETDVILEQQLALPDVAPDESIWLNATLLIGDMLTTGEQHGMPTTGPLDVIRDGLLSDDTSVIEVAVEAITLLPAIPDGIMETLRELSTSPDLPLPIMDRINMLLTSPTTDEVSASTSGSPGDPATGR